MKPKLSATVMTLLLATTGGLPAFAQGATSDEARVDARCEAELAEYGASVVQACQNDGWREAEQALDYRQNMSEAQRRCLAQAESGDVNMARACIENASNTAGSEAS